MNFAIFISKKQSFIDAFPGLIEEIQNTTNNHELDKAVKELYSSIKKYKNHPSTSFVRALRNMAFSIKGFNMGAPRFNVIASNANFGLRTG